MKARLLSRREWIALTERMCGKDIVSPNHEITVRPGYLDVSTDHGLSDVTIFVHEDGTDVRVGDVQLIVTRRKAALLVMSGSFSAGTEEFRLLWKGRFGVAS